MRILLLFFFFLHVTANDSSAEDTIKSSSLIADVKGFQTGVSFKLGLKLDINPEWHIYWSYPGNVGLPTKIELVLPEGVTSTGFNYPVPKKFKQLKNLNGYGYSGEQFFIADIFPDNYKLDSLPISVDLKWLACGNNKCIPGRKKVELILKRKAELALKNQDFFEAAQKNIPTTLSREQSDSGDQIVRLKSYSKLQGRHNVVLEWQYLPDDFSIYPELPYKTKVAKISETTSGLETRYNILYTGDTRDLKFLVVKIEEAGFSYSYRLSID